MCVRLPRLPRRLRSSPLGVATACLVAGAALGVTATMAVAAFFSTTSSSGSTFATASSFASTCSTGGVDWITGLEPGYTSTGIPFTSTAGVVNVESAVKRTGGHSVKVQKGAGSIGYARKSGFPINGNTHVLHFGFRVAALPTGDVTFAVLDQINSDLLLKYRASSQTLTLQWGTDPAVEALSTLQANTWYRIELKAITSTNPITAEWRIDGVAQTSISKAETGGAIGTIHLGSGNTTEAPAYTAYYDDIVHSKVASDYPFGDLHVSALRPNENGAHVNPGHFQHDDGTAINATTWTWLDDAAMFGGVDEVRQVTADTSSYLEFGWENPAESCVLGIQAYANSGSVGSSGNSVKMSVFDGTTETVIHSGATGCGNCLSMRSAYVTPATSSWTAARLNGLVLRLGYQRDATPVTQWGAAMLEYAAR
ncbi:MAG TPA: hypothetical protein VHF89_05015 [Solirubrobacteraceae bacterium]|nr:hypothetical protein [Solirubrobacteraceae bacterium]